MDQPKGKKSSQATTVRSEARVHFTRRLLEKSLSGRLIPSSKHAQSLQKAIAFPTFMSGGVSIYIYVYIYYIGLPEANRDATPPGSVVCNGTNLNLQSQQRERKQ